MSSEMTDSAQPSTRAQARGAVRTIEGLVVSDKMQKTIVVEIERVECHPKYKKYIRRHSRLKAHDEEEKAKEGDRVRIAHTRPISKTKNWRLVEIVSKGGV